MTMDFWKAQATARFRTTAALFVFFIMTLLIAIFAEYLAETLAATEYHEAFPVVGATFIVLTLTTAGYNYLMYRTQGGAYVAESVGAKPYSPEHATMKEKQLYNIVEEMSVASSIPIPAVYILDNPSINAFAAGLVPEKAAITVTRGALNQLSRDELQGVVAHECSHIKNGDMRISLQLAAMITGFFVLLYIGFRMLDISRFRREDSKDGNAFGAIAFTLLIAGSLAWLGGTILKSLVSRQREYLADASAVQYTRNPEGLIGALIKIKNESETAMPNYGRPYEHLYFDHRSRLFGIFDTHPPIDKRIAQLRGDLQ